LLRKNFKKQPKCYDIVSIWLLAGEFTVEDRCFFKWLLKGRERMDETIVGDVT